MWRVARYLPIKLKGVTFKKTAIAKRGVACKFIAVLCSRSRRLFGACTGSVAQSGRVNKCTLFRGAVTVYFDIRYKLKGVQAGWKTFVTVVTVQRVGLSGHFRCRIVFWNYTAWLKKMDSISYVYISWTIHGMWMLYITFERGGPKFSNTTARALA